MRATHLIQSSRRRRGLSLVELMVVAAIILIAMGMILAVVSKVWRVVESWKK
jgi:prepilin-type N-terminal cleavage/methylation domain-containing protein